MGTNLSFIYGCYGSVLCDDSILESTQKISAQELAAHIYQKIQRHLPAEQDQEMASLSIQLGFSDSDEDGFLEIDRKKIDDLLGLDRVIGEITLSQRLLQPDGNGLLSFTEFFPETKKSSAPVVHPETLEGRRDIQRALSKIKSNQSGAGLNMATLAEDLTEQAMSVAVHSSVDYTHRVGGVSEDGNWVQSGSLTGNGLVRLDCGGFRDIHLAKLLQLVEGRDKRFKSLDVSVTHFFPKSNRGAPSKAPKSSNKVSSMSRIPPRDWEEEWSTKLADERADSDEDSGLYGHFSIIIRHRKTGEFIVADNATAAYFGGEEDKRLSNREIAERIRTIHYRDDAEKVEFEIDKIKTKRLVNK